MTHTPFATPWLAFADVLRVFCVLGGCMLAAGAGARLIDPEDTTPQLRLGYLALALLCASAIGTEWTHVGAPVTYRLWLNSTGIAFGLVAVVVAHRRRRR